MGLQTDLIHRGERPAASGSTALTTPIYETATFVFNSAHDVERYQDGSLPAFLYSRYENPTLVAVEEKLAAVDGAEMALVFSSGMAATSTAMFSLLKAGDEVVCALGHLRRDVPPDRVAAARASASRGASSRSRNWRRRRPSSGRRRSWSGSSRPSIRRCAAWTFARSRRRAAPRVCCPASTTRSRARSISSRSRMGVDLSMQSATKYLNGHSDVTGGVLSGARQVLAPIAKTRRLLGGVMDPQPAYALSRGLKTLPIRVARHNANAMAVAQFLEGHPGGREGVLPGAAVASRPRHRREADDRLRRHGLRGRQGRTAGGVSRVRPARRHQARGQPRRRREPVQPADPHVAVRADRRGVEESRRDARDDAAVDRAGRSGRPDRRSAAGARLDRRPE